MNDAVIMPQMTIWEAYDRYHIMPNLKLHQLRVAAVARAIATARNADVELVTRAALLHDMGNIMKSDFNQFPPEFYGDKGREYWEGVKAECAAKFGTDEHAATSAIVRDMGVQEDVVTLIEGMGFSRAKEVLERGSLELQILEYADQRVAPYGVVSMEERLEEGHKRYQARDRTEYGDDDTEFNTNRELLRQIEAKLFEGLTITPGSLTEESLQTSIETLKNYKIAK